jgi:tRNA(fMet)-specific endonuclease VapC
MASIAGFHHTALCASKIRWQLEKSGKPISPYDLLLAAQAFALDITLVTGNRSEFSPVPDLRLENWTADA